MNALPTHSEWLALQRKHLDAPPSLVIAPLIPLVIRAVIEFVIPAKAGIQFLSCEVETRKIPACARMTKKIGFA